MAQSKLLRRAFVALSGVQFLAAINENLLRQVVIFMIATGIWSEAVGEGGQAMIGLCATLPFLLLSGYAGQTADRRSTRTVFVTLKIAELLIAALALWGLATRNLWISTLAVLLLTVVSTFCGPAKDGAIPEFVGEANLSRANGVIILLSNLAVMIGALAAGPLCDRYAPRTAASGDVVRALPWLPGVVLIVIAVAGLLTALAIPKGRPRSPGLPFDYNPVSTYVKTLKRIAGEPVMTVVVVWGLFHLFAALALLGLPEYEQILGISYTQTSYLILTLFVAIGAGSALAGLISGSRVRPGLIPLGAGGMAVFFLALGAAQPNYWTIGGCLVGAGIFAGVYVVPVQALLQKLAPEEERGRVLGTACAVAQCFGALGAVSYWLIARIAGLTVGQVFLIDAALVAVAAVWIWRRRDLRAAG